MIKKTPLERVGFLIIKITWLIIKANGIAA